MMVAKLLLDLFFVITIRLCLSLLHKGIKLYLSCESIQPKGSIDFNKLSLQHETNGISQTEPLKWSPKILSSSLTEGHSSPPNIMMLII